MAARFWVGGTGNWDASTTTNWSATTGGAGGQSVPGSADDVTFDASSGGGTVTLTTSPTVKSFTGGAHTGTFNLNGNNFTSATFKSSGAGVRTITFGSGTVTITDVGGTVFDMGTSTNLTVNVSSGTIKFQPSAALNANIGVAFPAESVVNAGGGMVWPNVVIDGTNTGSNPGFLRFSAASGPLHITNLTLANHAPFLILNNNGAVSNMTIGTSFSCPSTQNTSSGLGGFGANETVTLPNSTVLNYLAISGITFSGTSLTATNSFDLGGNTGITITGPSGGASGGAIVGS
jgi:hypothetical protein